MAVSVFQSLVGLPQFTRVTSSNSKVQLKWLCRLTYLELLEPKTCETCSALQEGKPADQTMITAETLKKQRGEFNMFNDHVVATCNYTIITTITFPIYHYNFCLLRYADECEIWKLIELSLRHFVDLTVVLVDFHP